MSIDGGSNNGMTGAGTGTSFFETPALDHNVDIVGATNRVDLAGLSMGT
jgi:hypothetical protein